MSTPAAKPVKNCIYCNVVVTNERRGEHIVPEAIGGECTLKEVAGKSVCGRCNNGVLSNLDREVCSRSHLSMIASQEIEASLWQVWDIDHNARDLLVEAKPFWKEGELRKLVCHPQMIFEKEGPQIRGDFAEMDRFGKERLLDVMVRAVHEAWARYTAGEKGVFHFERVRTDLTSRNYRLPPRVYAPRSMAEIEAKAGKQSFVFRYLTAEDRTAAMTAMSELVANRERNFKRSETFVGSRVPTISLYFDMGLVVRGLMKIAFNLLAAYCTKTVVNCNTFPHVTRLILGKRHPHPLHIAGNGFVHAKDLEELSRPKCHCFRITTLKNEWIVYMSFFGGKIGATVSFPGPNREDWNTLEIVAPIGSDKWEVKQSQVYQPLRVRIEWQNHKAVTPSLKLQFAQSRMLVEEVPVKPS